MDSLLANYASSDDDDQPPSPPPQLTPPPKSVKSIFNSLPPPKKSSLFNSLPPPKSNPKTQPEPQHQPQIDEHKPEVSKPKSSSSSLFTALPPPKSTSSSSSISSRKVVQFRPPTIVNPKIANFHDEDEDSDEGEQEKKRKREKQSISTSSATSFLSSIPAPRHSATLGAMPSASGRKSMLETDTPAATVSVSAVSVAGSSPDAVNTDHSRLSSENEIYYDHSTNLGGESYAYYGDYGDGSTDVSGVSAAGVDAGVSSNAGEYVGYANYGGGYADYGDNSGQYENNWADATAFSGAVGNAFQVPGKRGRKDIPPQIVEVKQDELMKNCPREDQVKMTGIAFGPAYQPASTKGKPTKLHKRKHQIGSLYFDMRQKEMELAERRSKGFLTKAQTQAKYGW